MSLVLYVSVLSLDLLGLRLTPCTKTISQWISNLGAKAIKLLEENMVILHNLGFIYVFLDMTQKHEQQKKKYDLEFISIGNFCSLKDVIKKVTRGIWLTQLEEHPTLDLRVVNSSWMWSLLIKM